MSIQEGGARARVLHLFVPSKVNQVIKTNSVIGGFEKHAFRISPFPLRYYL